MPIKRIGDPPPHHIDIARGTDSTAQIVTHRTASSKVTTDAEGFRKKRGEKKESLFESRNAVREKNRDGSDLP